MSSDFKSTRHQFGVAILAVACAITVVWVRGVMKVDLIAYPTGSGTWREWASSDGIIRSWNIKSDSVRYETAPTSFRWRSCSIMDALLMNGDEPLWRWRQNRQEAYQAAYNEPNWNWSVPCDLFIPYWSIVIPLTVISGSFMLTAPRQKPPTRSDGNE